MVTTHLKHQLLHFKYIDSALHYVKVWEMPPPQ